MATTLDLTCYAKQYEFLRDRHRYASFIGGIGTGKTRVGVYKALHKALTNPGSYGVITAPTYGLLRDTTLRTFLEICPKELIASFNKNEFEIVLHTPQGEPSHVQFRSTHDPENTLRGPNLLWGYMDEATLSPKMAYQLLLGRIRHGAEDEQQLWLTGTPKGFNWVHDEFGPAQTDPTFAQMVKARTADNPFLSAAFIQSIYNRYSGSFLKQELDGEFVGAEGLVYDIFRSDLHVGDFPFDPDLPVGVAWDFGFTDKSALLIFQQDHRGDIYQIDEIVRRGVLEEQMLSDLRVKPYFGNVSYGVADSARPDAIDRLSALGLSLSPVVKGPILDGIGKCRSLLLPDPLTDTVHFHLDRKCVETQMEFGQYRWREKKTQDDDGQWTNRPIDAWNHAMDAWRYFTETYWTPLGAAKDHGQIARTRAAARRKRIFGYQRI